MLFYYTVQTVTLSHDSQGHMHLTSSPMFLFLAVSFDSSGCVCAHSVLTCLLAQGEPSWGLAKFHINLFTHGSPHYNAPAPRMVEVSVAYCGRKCLDWVTVFMIVEGTVQSVLHSLCCRLNIKHAGGWRDAGCAAHGELWPHPKSTIRIDGISLLEDRRSGRDASSSINWWINEWSFVRSDRWGLRTTWLSWARSANVVWLTGSHLAVGQVFLLKLCRLTWKLSTGDPVKL